MRSASPTTSTTIPTSAAITRYAGPATGCAKNTACPSSSLAGIRARATYQAAQNGTSYKAKLKAAIDRLIPVSSSLEDLLARLQREGYEIKRGKYISARAPDQERFTRLKTLGADYTEAAVVSRIAGGPRPSRQPQQRSGKVSLLIDIQNNIKAQQSAGYQRWATIENLKRAAATMNLRRKMAEGIFAKVMAQRM